MPLLVPDDVGRANGRGVGCFDGFAHARSTWLDWRSAGAFDKLARVESGNPAQMVFVMHAECTFLPKELASLHAFGLGLTDEWALAPYGIDDATDAFFELKKEPRDFLWLAASNMNALVWGLHDWAHFHNHGPFEERAWTELQCDVSALAWLSENRELLELGDDDLRRIASEVREISRARFTLENKPFDSTYFDIEVFSTLSAKA